MTPNPDSPIIHEVPDDVCNASKQLAGLFCQLRNDVLNNRWDCITKDNISLTYNTDSGITEVVASLKDANNHMHSFMMQLLPDNGWGSTHEDIFALRYSFERNFNENYPETRSFTLYISDYLSYEGLDVSPFLHPYIERDKENKYIVKYTEGLNINCEIEYAYTAFCKLIDITLSHIKPLVWFYAKEPKIKSFDEMCYYLAGVKSRLQLESCNSRWDKVDPECFKLEIYKEEKDAALQVTYIVDEVWELSLSADVVQCDDYFDLSCTFNCYPDANLSDKVKRQLDVLFAGFLSTLKIAKGNTYVGCGDRKNHSINIQYFYIEDTFDLFCRMLDEIVSALQNFNFQLPLPNINYTEEIKAIKENMEADLNTTFEVVTEEQIINEKLKNGNFKI